MQGEGEIRRGDHASYYLVLDKCFEALFTGRLAALGFESLDGKTQMLYSGVVICPATVYMLPFGQAEYSATDTGVCDAIADCGACAGGL